MIPAPNTGSATDTPKTRRRLSLRAFLTLLILGLSLVTVGGTGLIAYRLSYRSLTKLKQEEFAVDNRAAATEIETFLDDPAQRILSEYTHRARIGMLPLQDGLALGRELAERLRSREQLAWISYSDAKTGGFVGARRDKSGALILNRSFPVVNSGVPEEQIVGEDGRLTPYLPGKPHTPYDPRTTAWFARAAQSGTTVWSPPYDFADGEYGITASRAWREEGAAGTAGVAGVFTIDFFLRDLDAEMGKLSREENDFVSVFEPDGSLLCAPKNYLHGPLAATLGALVKSTFAANTAGAPGRQLTMRQDGRQYLVAFQYLETSTGLRCVVASVAETSRIYRDVTTTAFTIAGTGLLALAVALGFGWGIAKRISRPLVVLSDDLKKVGEFDLTPGPLKKSVIREVQTLIEASERMKSGLRSFLRYVPQELVRLLLRSGHEAAPGVEQRRLTILFSDIENFTGYSERVQPARLVEDLSGYFDILTREVWRHSGTVDKFIGDGLLAFFNAPLDVPGHERCACETALAAIEALESVGGESEGRLPFRTRIGLHAGEVLVGNIGTKERFAYTALGDPVNAASRIEALNKVYGTTILASEDVRDKAGDGFEWRRLDLVAVAGRRGALHIHELLGLKGADIGADILRARDLYEQALASYFAQDLTRAQELFASASAARPADKAAKVMMGRCEDLIKNNPGENWDGVFVHKHK